MGNKTGNTANYFEDKETEFQGKLGGFSLKQCREFFGLKNDTKRRECIICAKKFSSEHAGVRFCPKCR